MTGIALKMKDNGKGQKTERKKEYNITFYYTTTCK